MAEVVVVEVLPRHPRVVRRERGRGVRGVDERHVHRLLGPPHLGRVGDQQRHPEERDREHHLRADPQAPSRRVLRRQRARRHPVRPPPRPPAARLVALGQPRRQRAPAQPPRARPRSPAAPPRPPPCPCRTAPRRASRPSTPPTSRAAARAAWRSRAPRPAAARRRARPAARPPGRRPRPPRRTRALGACLAPEASGRSGRFRRLIPHEHLRARRRPAADDRRVRARGPVAQRVQRLRAPDHGDPAARRRRGGRRRGRHLRGRRPHRPAGARPGAPARRRVDVRDVLPAPRRARPVPGRRAEVPDLPQLPPLGVRERGARPRAAPGGPVAGRRARARAAPDHLRGVLADGRAADDRPGHAPPRALPGPALQARRHAGLGRRS